jgi:flagellar secretion chaperone FliS
MNSPLSAYKETSIKTASQGRLIVMLYEEAIRQLEMAADLISKGGKSRYDEVNKGITKAQAILSELMSSLDMKAGGEIASNLMNLYLYFNQTLLEANITKDRDKLLQIARFMDELRGAWATIENRVPTERAVPRTAINIAG